MKTQTIIITTLIASCLRGVGFAAEIKGNRPDPATAQREYEARKREANRKFLAEETAPITFYGKVIDQDNQPLQGVRVQLNIFQWHEPSPGNVEGKQTILDRVTNPDGLFSITEAKGSGLAIESMEKEGYVLSGKATRHFGYQGAGGFKPIEFQPVIFKMWKLKGAEPLRASDPFKDLYKIVPDGRIYTMDLMLDKWTEGATNGDFKVQVTRPAGKFIPVKKEKYDWSFVIQAINGGVIKTDDEFMYQAPEAGYQEKYEFKMSADDPQWKDRVERMQFYLRTRNGQLYTRIVVTVISNYNYVQENGAFRVEYYANPAGSRNLEYDSRKKIPPAKEKKESGKNQK